MIIFIIALILTCGYIGYRVYRSIELDEIMDMRRQAGLDNKKEDYHG